ncbi:MAG: hypothetical protein KJ915_13120 [Candidatus Omnitrophica bacterium]|nr:hypothetical protein [Candidatus Omnitrophota bacterium]
MNETWKRRIRTAEAFGIYLAVVIPAIAILLFISSFTEKNKTPVWDKTDRIIIKEKIYTKTAAVWIQGKRWSPLTLKKYWGLSPIQKKWIKSLKESEQVRYYSMDMRTNIVTEIDKDGHPILDKGDYHANTIK